jgi:hypothetical protein
LGVEEFVADEGGEDRGQHVAGEVHGPGDLAGGAPLGVVVGEVQQRAYGVVGLFGERQLHDYQSTISRIDVDQ